MLRKYRQCRNADLNKRFALLLTFIFVLFYNLLASYKTFVAGSATTTLTKTFQ